MSNVKCSGAALPGKDGMVLRSYEKGRYPDSKWVRVELEFKTKATSVTNNGKSDRTKQ